MRIAAIRCVEYAGTLDGTDGFWQERLIHPAGVHAAFRKAGPMVAEDDPRRLRAIFVHVDTDAGLTGTGGPISAEQAHLVAQFGRLIVGQNALATEYLWDVLYRHQVHGRKGIEMMAISALDCALWDLKGRHFGVPVHALLGGPMRASIPAYASTLGFSHEPEDIHAAAVTLTQQGYSAMKWFVRRGPMDGRAGAGENLALISTVRAAVGPDVDIMVDAWMSWDVPYTLRMAALLEELSPRWIEEPVLPDLVDSYAEITRRVPRTIQISGGEHEYTRWGFHRLMAAAAMHVYQPDTYWAGGISEMCKIAALASAHDVQLIPHGHSMQANAHVSFAQSPTLTPLIEYLVKPNALRQWFFTNPLHPTNGEVLAPTAPGLGMDLDDRKIEARRELVRC